MKKITIVGRGTVGCIAVSHFLKWTDWKIDWVYDPEIQPAAVGEGTNLTLPRSLRENLLLNTDDMLALNATNKLGISKRDWGKGGEFNHTFPIGVAGIHFNAVIFQDYVFNKLKNNPRLKLIERNIAVDDIDSDYIMVCTGTPTSFDDEYKLVEHIPVNACVVSQCPWDYPKFNHTLTYAMPNGWVFGIPLQNRCAIGYIYNDKFATEEQIKLEAQELLTELKLVPSVQRSLKFNNYYKKENFTDRIIYNGNASFFLEPLEATSTGVACIINRLAIDLFNSDTDIKKANEFYHKTLNEIEAMICLHYFAGSSFNTDFWNYAKKLGTKKIGTMMAYENPFSNMINSVYAPPDVQNKIMGSNKEVGTWPLISYIANIEGLGIKDKLRNYISVEDERIRKPY